MANRNFLSQKMYQMEAYPVLLSCNFVVASANGLGITGLKGGAIRNVFMHTSTTPTANNGYTNPNPENGIIAVQLADNYNKFLGLGQARVCVLDGSSQTSTTAGRASVISVLGTATTAQWVAKGLPVGVTPAVGVCFIATATGAIGGSGAVQRPITSGISSIELCAAPNASLSVSNQPQNGGGWLYFECQSPSFAGSALASHAHDLLVKGGQAAASTDAVSVKAAVLGKESATDATVLGANSATSGGVLANSAGTPAGTISFARTAPTDGAMVFLEFYMSNSSVTVQGQ